MLIPRFAEAAVREIVFTSERLRMYKISSQLSRAEKDPWRQLAPQIELEIDADLERVHESARRVFGYKRTEFEVERVAALRGGIVTKHFRYVVEATRSVAQLREVIWRKEIGFTDIKQVPNEEKFTAAFGDELDAVVIRYNQPVGIERIIDSVESVERPDMRLTYDLKCTWCEIEDRRLHTTLRFEGGDLKLMRQPGIPGSISSMFKLLLASF